MATATRALRGEPSVPVPGPAAGKHMAFFLTDLNGGGVQRMVVILAGAFLARGAAVDVVVCDPSGHLRAQLPDGVKLVPLERSSWLESRVAALRADIGGLFALVKPLFSPKHPWKKVTYLPALARYLRDARPDALFSATPYLNIQSVLARRLAGVPTRVVVSERTHFSLGKERKKWRARYLVGAMRRTYRQADAITAVSRGVADDLARALALPPEAVIALHNPTLTPDFAEKAARPVHHPWFEDAGVPVLVAVGRLAFQKDYPTLLRAFARVRRQREARLLIIGDPGHGKEQAARREAFYEQAAELGVRDDLELLGYIENPIPYMKRATVFVLSSLFEGFPNVILEALAAGAPVVSTDCPSGPDEILDGGKYGALVPVGDDAALASAILETLDHPPPAERQRGRAAVFGYDAAIARYEAILLGLGEAAAP